RVLFRSDRGQPGPAGGRTPVLPRPPVPAVAAADRPPDLRLRPGRAALPPRVIPCRRALCGGPERPGGPSISITVSPATMAGRTRSDGGGRPFGRPPPSERLPTPQPASLQSQWTVT